MRLVGGHIGGEGHIRDSSTASCGPSQVFLLLGMGRVAHYYLDTGSFRGLVQSFGIPKTSPPVWALIW